MPFFFYRAFDQNGRVYSGILEAVSNREVYSHLTETGLVPERIIKLPTFLVKIIEPKPYMSEEEIVDFLKAVGHGVRSGIPLNEVLVDFEKELSSRRARAAVHRILSTLFQGIPFSVALKRLGFFPHIVVAFASTGERTGMLGDALLRAAERVSFMIGVKKKAKSSMVYPTVTMVSVGLSVGIWVFFLIPKIASFLVGMGIKLPFYTVWLLNLSKYGGKWYVAVAFVLIPMFLVFLVRLINKVFPKGSLVRYVKDRFFLSLPIVGGLIKDYNYFIISSAFGSLVEAGVTMNELMFLLEEVITNSVFYRFIRDIDEDIKAGASISSAFKETGGFTPIFTRYISIGERTGTLDKQLHFLAQFYKDRFEGKLSVIPRIIEPVLLVVAGGIMVFMIISVFLPIYSSISKITGKL